MFRGTRVMWVAAFAIASCLGACSPDGGKALDGETPAALEMSVAVSESTGEPTTRHYALQESIWSASKNSVYYAEAFLRQKGMADVARVDFTKTKQEEQPKLDEMMRFWESLPDKDEVDEEFAAFLTIQSPLADGGEW